MPIIKIPKHFLVEQNEAFITVNVPLSMIINWQQVYAKIAKAKGILKRKREAMLKHLQTSRQEWDR